MSCGGKQRMAEKDSLVAALQVASSGSESVFAAFTFPFQVLPMISRLNFLLNFLLGHLTTHSLTTFIWNSAATNHPSPPCLTV